MKTFIVALILLSVVIAFIIVNAFVTRSIINDLTALTMLLPYPGEAGDGEAALGELTRLWDKKKIWLYATAKTFELKKVEECFTLLDAAYEASGTAEFAAAKLSLLEGLSALAEIACFKVHNLL